MPALLYEDDEQRMHLSVIYLHCCPWLIGSFRFSYCCLHFGIGILAMEKQIDSCLHFVLVFSQWKKELIHVYILYWYSGNGNTD
jgi:hypothetical protein